MTEPALPKHVIERLEIAIFTGETLQLNWAEPDSSQAEGNTDQCAHSRSSRFCVRTRRGDCRAVTLHKGAATPCARKSGRAPSGLAPQVPRSCAGSGRQPPCRMLMSAANRIRVAPTLAWCVSLRSTHPTAQACSGCSNTARFDLPSRYEPLVEGVTGRGEGADCLSEASFSAAGLARPEQGSRANPGRVSWLLLCTSKEVTRGALPKQRLAGGKTKAP